MVITLLRNPMEESDAFRVSAKASGEVSCYSSEYLLLYSYGI